MFLLARELDPHRPAHRARQQGGVGGYVVGAIAAVAAGRLHADDLHPLFGQVEQLGQVGAQDMWILGPRPYDQAVGSIVGHRARRPDRAMHLVGPKIFTPQRLGRTRDRRVHVALVQQHARAARVGSQRAR